MNPFGLPEQDPAVIRIREAAARDTLSHALLFTGGEPMPAARFAAAALECEGEGTRPWRTMSCLPQGAGGYSSRRDHGAG